MEFHVKPVEQKYESTALKSPRSAGEQMNVVVFQLLGSLWTQGAFSTSGPVGSFRGLEYRRGHGDGAVRNTFRFSIPYSREGP